MTTTDIAKSPLEHVWRQFVPQGHDQALRNAFYNVAAAVFVVGAAAAAWSVYLILEPFVQALMWAVLCGSVLHPVKHKVATSVRKWLYDVQETKSLLSLSVTLLPVTCLDNLSEFVGWYVMNHMQAVTVVTVVLPLVYIVIHHTPSFLSQLAYTFVSFIYYIMHYILGIVGYLNYLVIVAVLVYFGLIIFALTPQNEKLIRRLSLPVWILATASISCWWPSMSVPLFLIFTFLLIGGLWTEVVDISTSPEGGSNIVTSVFAVCKGEVCDKGERDPILLLKNEDESIPEKEIENIPEQPETPDDDQTLSADTSDKTEVEEKPAVVVDDLRQTPPGLHVLRPSKLHSSTFHSQRMAANDNAKSLNANDDNSNKYLKTVFVACVLVELWRHSYLLSLLPLSMGYYCVKKATSYHIFGEGYFRGKMNNAQESAHENLHKWFESRKRILLHFPLRGVFKLLKRSDRRIVQSLISSVDAVVTIVIMFGCLCFVVIASIFLAVQIQGEGMQLIAMGSQLVNATIVNNPQFHELLPEGIGNVVGSALDNGYLYGREWISNMVRGMLGATSEEKAAALEKQVVELWDRIYQAWVVAHPQAPFSGPVMNSEAVAITFDSLVDGLMKSPGLISFSTLSDVVKDNIGTVMSVMEGVWTILLSNLSLALSALTAASSLVLGGSLSILNALLNLVVFMSSLFYILSISIDVYKPVGILSGLAPAQMNSLGTAVEESVNGVFKASFKMGAFYGMWTWLLHSLFATNIVYIPAVLGAIFGAVPLVGTYWAAVPGALELFWGHGSPMLALLLIVAQLLPLSCVDTAIYSEIKGGGHPYLTGLAVAGGIFCWGVEGAILGPLVLCILLVVTKMYTSLIQSPSTDMTQRFKNLRRTATLL